MQVPGVQEGAVAISAVGLASSLGVRASSACAAARAGITRPAPLDLELEDLGTGLGAPVTGHPARGVTDGFVGLGRLWRLADPALEDLQQSGGFALEDGQSTCLWLHLRDAYYDRVANALDPAASLEELRQQMPEEMQEEREEYERQIKNSLLPRLGRRLGIPPGQQVASFGSAAGFVAALAGAQALAAERQLRRCIVGAIDSLVEPAVLQTLASLNLLKSDVNPAALIPGECAAFVALDTPLSLGQARGRTRRPLIMLEGIAQHLEAEQHRFSETSPDGFQLAETIAATLRQLGPRPAPAVAVGDLNGDPYRAARFGHALVRLRAAGISGDFDSWVPATTFGDTGAASLALGICVAVTAFARDYARGSSALVWSGPDDGSSASCLITSEPGVEDGHP